MTDFLIEVKTPNLRREIVVGSRRFSNYFWATVIFLGAFGFFIVGVSSYFQSSLFPFFVVKGILFFPQGLVMTFYGIAGLLLSLYLWLTIFWSVGGGYNEFNKDEGVLKVFRWGFPGKNRRISLVYPLTDVEAVTVDIKEGINPRRIIYLRLQGKRQIPLTRVGQPLTLAEIEQQAAELASFLQVSLEGI